MKLGQDRTRVSLYHSNGTFLGDLTRFMKAGNYGRDLNQTSTFTGVFESDFDQIFGNIDFLSTSILCERGVDNTKESGLRDQWYGPITNPKETAGVWSIIGSDVTSAWKRGPVPTKVYNDKDAVSITADLIDSIFRSNPWVLPVVDSEISGSLLSVSFDEADDKYLADVVSQFPRLNYFAFGRTVYLRGSDSQSGPSLSLNDQSWVDLPGVEHAGNEYANRVVVRGTGVRGVAEAPEDEIEYRGGIYQRTFNRPEITTESAADNAAEELLAQTRIPVYIDPGDNAVLSPDVPILLENLLPGILVDVDHSVTARPIRQRFLLSGVNVDCMTGAVSVRLDPLKNLET